MCIYALVDYIRFWRVVERDNMIVSLKAKAKQLIVGAGLGNHSINSETDATFNSYILLFFPN